MAHASLALKAYLAQLRGAVGVIIYNAFLDSDPSGGLINMAGGDYGMDVTIPVAFVPNGTGTTLKAQIDAGTTTIAFLGAKVGAFQMTWLCRLTRSFLLLRWHVLS